VAFRSTSSLQQQRLTRRTPHNGIGHITHPALRVKFALSDGKHCERCAPEVKDHAAERPRTEPTAAWRWIGGAATCARYVRRGAGSSPSSVHCQSSRNTHSGHVACCSVARAAIAPVCGDVAGTKLRRLAARDSTDPSPSYAAPPSCPSEIDPSTE
jgi:hypothetical protein